MVLWGEVVLCDVVWCCVGEVVLCGVDVGRWEAVVVWGMVYGVVWWFRG